MIALVQYTLEKIRKCPKTHFQNAILVEIIPPMSDILDEIDRRLLTLLQQDASLSVDSLAERVHLSRNACWRRIKRLETDGVVKKRVAIIDPSAVGLGLQVFVLIRTNDHSATWLKAFRKAVREMPEIIAAQRMTGDLDYVLRVRVADVPAYDQFYQRLIDKVQIADVSASFVMEDLKETTALPV
jgi:Lrp/AsnC family transcriptional regulator